MTEFEDAAAAVASGADPRKEAASLVALMTHEERMWCLDGDLPFWAGLGDLGTGGYHRRPFPAARVERLGIPGFSFSDGPRGVVIGPATCFPVSMARGATWDVDLEERIGDAIGRELRAVGADLYGGVCVNVLRHPAWGRAQETYGEDPHHVGEMGAALARGVQRHAMACVKHFACNSMENARFKVDVAVDEVALHEVYLPHFRRIVDDVTVVRSMNTDQFNHAPAELFVHTGNMRAGSASIGSWATYGLGSDNQDLPGFVVLLSGGTDPTGGKSLWSSGFLPSVYQGVQCRSKGDPVLYVSDPAGMDRDVRRRD